MRCVAGIGMILITLAVPLIGMSSADEHQVAVGSSNTATSIGECKVCHSDPTSRGLRDYTERLKSLDFCLLNESVTWEDQDPHSKAYAVLSSPLGKRMSEKLKRDVTTDTACLACHATDTNPKQTKKEPSQFVRSDSLGIGCQGCHGVGKEWQSDHYRILESPNGPTIPWRNKSPDDKFKAGLVNLRDPQVKAESCVSCHVGSVAEGKVITHAMYSAGHPPLPPFEMSTFTHDEPAHWKSPFELTFFDSLTEQQARETFSYFKQESGDGTAVRQTIVGFIAALKAEVKLLEDGAMSKPTAGLDYARFDCYACHHELRTPSDRQDRGYDGPPGRPPLKAWIGISALTVARHLTTHADLKALGESFPTLWGELQKAAFAKPFGDPDRITVAAKPVLDWCDAVLKEVAKKPYWQGDSAKQFHAELLTVAKDSKTLADPEAAMVLLWAYRSLDRFIQKSQHDWKTVSAVIPTRVRESGRTAGDANGPRMTQFNAIKSADVKRILDELPKPRR